MTAEEFRRMALSLPEAEERRHMGHPDFRVNKKIFATLCYPSAEYGVVLLPPAEQEKLVRDHPPFFAPVKGSWGLRGNTQVRLAKVDQRTLASALEAAWRKVAPKRLSDATMRRV